MCLCLRLCGLCVLFDVCEVLLCVWCVCGGCVFVVCGFDVCGFDVYVCVVSGVCMWSVWVCMREVCLFVGCVCACGVRVCCV